MKLVLSASLMFFWISGTNAASIVYSPSAAPSRTSIDFAEQIGQSFVAEDALVKAGLYITAINPGLSDSDPIVYELFEQFTVDASNLIASYSFNLNEPFDGFYLVDFSVTPLTVGTTYTLVASIDGDSRLWGVLGTDEAPIDSSVCFSSAPCGAGREFALSVQPIPIPPGAWLFGSGILGFLGLLHRGYKVNDEKA